MDATRTTPRHAPAAALVVLLALLVALLPLPAPAASAAPAAPKQPVLVVGIPGLVWDDVTPQRMPNLYRLAQTGGTASLVVRTIHDTTCPFDGWLTLGAGARATGPAGACTPLPALTKAGVVPAATWTAAADATRRSRSGAHLGSLALRIGTTGACAAALGPGAALALADTDGQVDVRSTTADAASVRKGFAGCRLVVADLGAVRAGGSRDAQVAAADRRLGELVAAAGSKTSVVVAALADAGGPARLRPLVVRASGYDGHVLTSASTRQAGLVLLTDLTPTLTTFLDITPDASWTGDPLRVAGAGPGAERVAAARDTDLLAQRGLDVIGPFFTVWFVAAAVLGGLLVAGAVLGLVAGRTARHAGVVLALLTGAMPAATFVARLVPWWRSGSPLVVVLVATAAVALVIVALALAGPWRRHPLGPTAVVAGVTMLVLLADVGTGSHLTISSLIGEHPTVGGRFYGLGNAASGILAAATLLLMTALLELGLDVGRRRAAALAALALGLVVVALVAAPSVGADFGGTIALLPAVALLALRGLGARLGTGRLAAVGVVSVAVVAVVSMLDWMRPADQRTHLGRFVDSVVNGGGGDVVGRKLIQNWTILTSSLWTMLVPVATLLLVLAVWRPHRVPGRPFDAAFTRLPMLRAGLLAVAVMLLLAMVLNDSGATVPVPVGMLVVPLTLATCLLAGRERTVSGEGQGATRGRGAPARHRGTARRGAAGRPDRDR